MEYTVVRTKQIIELIQEVNLLIKEGWVPQGGVCQSTADAPVNFYQAMVRALNEIETEEKHILLKKLEKHISKLICHGQMKPIKN